MIQIAVIGDSESTPEVEKIAEEVGREIAKRSCILLTGGRGGVMAAACRGAQQAGGITLGILPGENKTESNSFCTVTIATGMGWARNSIIALSADGLIAIGGRAGTLSEIAYSWMHKKPLIAISGIPGWSTQLAGKRIDDRNSNPIREAKSADEAVSMLLDLIQTR